MRPFFNINSITAALACAFSINAAYAIDGAEVTNHQARQAKLLKARSQLYQQQAAQISNMSQTFIESNPQSEEMRSQVASVNLRTNVQSSSEKTAPPPIPPQISQRFKSMTGYWQDDEAAQWSDIASNPQLNYNWSGGVVLEVYEDGKFSMELDHGCRLDGFLLPTVSNIQGTGKMTNCPNRHMNRTYSVQAQPGNKVMRMMVSSFTAYPKAAQQDAWFLETELTKN